MNEIQLHALMRGVLVPILVSGSLALLGTLLPGAMRLVVRNLGAATGFALAYILLLGLPGWPPFGAPGGILAAACLAGVWPVFERLSVSRLWLRRYVLLLIVMALVLQPLARGLWTLAQTGQIFTVAATLGTLLWYLAEKGMMKMPSAAAYAVWTVTAAGLAGLFLFEASASMFQLMGAVAAIAGTLTVLSLVRVLKIGQEYLPFLMLVMTALVMSHMFLVESRWTWIFIILGSLAYLGLRAVLNVNFKQPLTDLVSSAFVSLLPVAWVLWQAYQSYKENASGY